MKESDNPSYMKHSKCGMCSLCVTDADETESLTWLKVAEFHTLMFYSRVVDGFFGGWGEWGERGLNIFDIITHITQISQIRI